jgi:hypothetical protein
MPHQLYENRQNQLDEFFVKLASALGPLCDSAADRIPWALFAGSADQCRLTRQGDDLADQPTTKCQRCPGHTDPFQTQCVTRMKAEPILWCDEHGDLAGRSAIWAIFSSKNLSMLEGTLRGEPSGRYCAIVVRPGDAVHVPTVFLGTINIHNPLFLILKQGIETMLKELTDGQPPEHAAKTANHIIDEGLDNIINDPRSARLTRDVFRNWKKRIKCVAGVTPDA